ncbi:unnamed protein product [Rhizoctonia solani]|uniref:Uncharacterized protein n=1 Tax=Rhizoctonia solani TaxID=456999 RepID=A0A8H3AS17_9AGAM|nr:unnamed protein product [Rhizoctonia solani]
MDSNVTLQSGLASTPLPDAVVTAEELSEVPPVTANTLSEPMSEKSTLILADETSSTLTVINSRTDRPNVRPHSTLLLPSFSKTSNFFRNVQWCADGSSLLGVTEHASLEVLDLTNQENTVELKHRVSLPQPAPILSTTWFPTASTLDPASYCFVAATRDAPIKLFDASDGRV